MNTKKHTISVDQIQNLEIDRNGRVMPRLNDLDPLENTLLSVLYPGVKVASVNVPVEPLDEYEESKVENALAKLAWRGVHYKLVGASGSAKKGKFYFVDQEHSRAIAERFQHWPQAAIVYFGILVSSCKVMMEEPDARVLVVPDHSLGTNDCSGWIAKHKAIVQLASKYGLCIRYPIRMVDDLAEFFQSLNWHLFFRGKGNELHDQPPTLGLGL